MGIERQRSGEDTGVTFGGRLATNPAGVSMFDKKRDLKEHDFLMRV